MLSAFLIAAPHSGSGKTTVSLALMAALKARRLRVQAFKVGPDYIDPAHHAVLTGRPSHNLDTWMLAAEANRRIFEAATCDADVTITEGVMGLFDGVDGRRPEGSSAHLARLLGLPVVLVVDARSMARSAAALVFGFTRFEPELRFAGVIWNRVGSPSHRRILDEALDAARLPPSLGAIPRDEGATLPERHLGLVTPEDVNLDEGFAEKLSRLAEDHVDLDALLAATTLPQIPSAPSTGGTEDRSRGAGRLPLAVARDAAFCFYYEENLKILERAGAEVVLFRPVEGDGIPPGVRGLYLGGGYPEVHAERLARNEAFRAAVRDLHERKVPIYAECGGFMALCREVEDLDGRRHPMAGIYPTVARISDRGFRLGYRQVEVRGLPDMGGLVARGHEFHYSSIDPMPEDVPRAYAVCNARGEALPAEGYLSGRTLGGYIHLHFASNPELPRRFFGLA